MARTPSFEGLIFQTGREQNTVRGILRLNGQWVQGSPPAAPRGAVLILARTLIPHRTASPATLSK